MRLLISLLLSIFILSGCSGLNRSSASLLEDLIEQHINQDIFLLNQRVYKNAENIDWVREKPFTINQPIGTITKQYDGEDFQEAMATKLPIGAKIYSTVENNWLVVIVIYNGQEIKYMAIMEG